MNLRPFKQDIDELINEFAKGGSTTLADMKGIWLAKKFCFIFEASPSTNHACFMQSLYAHSIGFMVSFASLSHRLGGLYCLYCLHETQPFKPPFKIYLSIGELRGLKNLVIDAKGKGIKVASVLVNSMLERNMFLFGFVDISESSVEVRVNELTDMQNARVQVAYNKLFSNTRIEHFIHMDLGKELEADLLKKMSTDYAVAKEQAIKVLVSQSIGVSSTFHGPLFYLFHSIPNFIINLLIPALLYNHISLETEWASEVVDVENIKHIAENKVLIGDVVAKTAKDWSIQKELFYQQTGDGWHPAEPSQQQEGNQNLQQHEGDEEQEDNQNSEEQEDDENFGMELEEELLSHP